VPIIGVPFAFSGIQGYLQSTTDPVVAKIGDTKITQAQLRSAFDQRYRQLQQMLGDQFRADQINSARLRESVLNDMVQESLLRQYARKTGYRASDLALRDYLLQIPAFQDGGKFSADRYHELLTRAGQTPERFEAQSRDALMVDQIRTAVLGSSFVTPAEADGRARLQNQRRDFAWLRFDPAKSLATISVGDDEVAKRYDEKKASYQAPERIKLAYVQLSLDDLQKAAAPTPEMLKTLYEAEKATRFSTPEVRHAAHILVSFGADKAAAKKKAEDLYAKLKGGADFAALAKDNSDDSGSKNKGGDVGQVKRGDKLFPEQFERALFGLGKAGEISEPVETEFGFHIIRLVELQPARTQAFEEAAVQKTLTELFQQSDAQRHFQELSTKLEEKAFDLPTSLDPVAKELGLKVETTDWFTRAGGAGVAANQAVIAAAFSPDVLTSNENSKPITIDATHLVVVRKAEYEAPRQRELAEVSASIRDELKTEKARAKAKADADAALAALGEGKAIAAVATAAGVAVQSPGPIKRDASNLSRALVDAVFKLPRPAGDQPSTGVATLEGGEIAVLALSKVDDSIDDKAKEAAKAEIASARDARGGAEFAAYRAALHKRIDVDVKPLPKDDNTAP
jgi:peptidyl-prolyl cis-trans isomerase D